MFLEHKLRDITFLSNVKERWHRKNALLTYYLGCELNQCLTGETLCVTGRYLVWISELWWSNTGLRHPCVSTCACKVNRTTGWAGKRLEDVVLTWWLLIKRSPFPFLTPRFPLASGEDAPGLNVWLLVSMSRDDVAVSKARGCQEMFEVGAEWTDVLLRFQYVVHSPVQ